MTLKTPEQVFSSWARQGRAHKMEAHHLPVVQKIFADISKKSGDYLEIGCGTGYGVALMAKQQHMNGECIGIDNSAPMIEIAKARTAAGNVHFLREDFLAWRPNRTFGTIFSMETFYYFPHVGAAIAKAAGLLAKGGELIIAVDYYEENMATHGWPEELCTPMTLLSKREYEGAFRSAGLKNVRQSIIPPPKEQAREEIGTLVTWGVRG